METYTEARALVDNPHFRDQKRKSLADLKEAKIDTPLAGLIDALNRLPYCFTMQCCFGHFLYSGQDDPHNLEPLPPPGRIETVEYRIAYITFCIDNSLSGKTFLSELGEITDIDPGCIQLCSADWFWARQVNSYAFQVEPYRFRTEDRVQIPFSEAVRLERTRNTFFDRLGELLRKRQNDHHP